MAFLRHARRNSVNGVAVRIDERETAACGAPPLRGTRSAYRMKSPGWYVGRARIGHGVEYSRRSDGIDTQGEEVFAHPMNLGSAGRTFRKDAFDRRYQIPLKAGESLKLPLAVALINVEFVGVAQHARPPFRVTRRTGAELSGPKPGDAS